MGSESTPNLDRSDDIASTIRLTGGTRRLLGFSSKISFQPAPIVSIRAAATGLLAEAMANRGGGLNPNRGRGHTGGAGRGNGGGRWNGGGGNFGSGRGNNYFEGSSTGTAGQGEETNRESDQHGGGFDGVFRAGYGNYEGDRARFNNGPGYNRGADRRTFGNQGNYTYRRINNGYNGRDARNSSNARANNNVTDVEGLTAEQNLLVKEAATAFAKQLAELSKQGGQTETSATAAVCTDVNQTAAPSRDMEHDGQNGNNEHADMPDASNPGDKQDGNGGGTGNFSSNSVHGQNLAFSPIKFGVVGSETIVNGEILISVPKSPNVQFSAQIENFLNNDVCVKSLDSAFAAEEEKETQETAVLSHASPVLSAVADLSAVGPPGHGPAQPSMHGSQMVTSIGAASAAGDVAAPSPAWTPVGVRQVLNKVMEDSPGAIMKNLFISSTLSNLSHLVSVSNLLLGTDVRGASTGFIEPAFVSDQPIYVIRPQCKSSDSDILITVDATDDQKAIAYVYIFGLGFMAGALIHNFIEGEFPRHWITVLEIIPAFALYRGLYELGQYAIRASATGYPGMRWGDLNDRNNGMKDVLIIIVLEWLVLLPIAYYFDHASSAGHKSSPLSMIKCVLNKKATRRRINANAIVNEDIHVELEMIDVIKEREVVDQILQQRSSGYAIVCDDLKKLYHGKDGNPDKFAVRGVSLALPYGECLGILGPNGAGKSSFISMMIGLTKPTSGNAFVEDFNIQTNMENIYNNMGVCPQNDMLWEMLTGREHLQFYGRLKNLNGSSLDLAVEESLRSVNLLHGGAPDKQVRTYSGGMQRRLSVAISLIGVLKYSIRQYFFDSLRNYTLLTFS
ncbi:hypothetical protein ACQ4PT_035933 [Festuca glaucescens]